MLGWMPPPSPCVIEVALNGATPKAANPRVPRTPQEIAAETYISPTRFAPILKSVIEGYMAKSGIALKPEYESDNLTSTMSLVASTGGVTVLPIVLEAVWTERTFRTPEVMLAEVIEMGVDETEVARPLTSKFTTGIAVAEPIVPGVELTVASVAVADPGPEAVTSPVMAVR